MNRLFEIFGSFVLISVLAVGIGLLFSLPVMLLWNYCLVGAIAGVSKIGWLQAWGIMILCAFLFKSSGSSESA